MRYFHRTSLSPDDVMAEADAFFGVHGAAAVSEPRRRTFRAAAGTIAVHVRPEGGHYTLVTVSTDQVAESEADKLAKRFLGGVHQRVDRSHRVRGAY